MDLLVNVGHLCVLLKCQYFFQQHLNATLFSAIIPPQIQIQVLLTAFKWSCGWIKKLKDIISFLPCAHYVQWLLKFNSTFLIHKIQQVQLLLRADQRLDAASSCFSAEHNHFSEHLQGHQEPSGVLPCPRAHQGTEPVGFISDFNTFIFL